MTNLSIIIPAHNEAEYITKCLTSILQSHFEEHIQAIVVSNASRDGTAEKASELSEDFQTRGWRLDIIETPTPGKIGAIKMGEEIAHHSAKVFLDADIILDQDLLRKLSTSLSSDLPRYCSGQMHVVKPKSLISRLYLKTWRETPYMKEDAPGAGLFSVNQSGRMKWGDFPDVISDDTFVRWNFLPSERIEVDAAYFWPLPEGFANLVRARRRQDAGVKEIKERLPDLNKNHSQTGSRALIKLFIKSPISAVVYFSIVLIARSKATHGWERGR